MTDHEQWLQFNTDYLQNAIHWIRLQLERQIKPNTPVKASPPAKKRWFTGRKAKRPPQTDQNFIEDAIAEVSKVLVKAESNDPPPALIILANQFGLTKAERNVLLLCTAMELDDEMADLCARVQNNSYKPYPTFALAAKVFDDYHWDVPSAERPLRYWRLLEINQPGAEPLVTSALRADERIVNFIVEPRRNIDDRLLPFIAKDNGVSGYTDLLSHSQLNTANALSHYLKQNQTKTLATALVVQLTGKNRLAKQSVARHALAALDLQLKQFFIESLPTNPADLETLTRLWGRECQLLPYVCFLDIHDEEKNLPATSTLLQLFQRNYGGVVIVATREIRPELGGFLLEVNKPTAIEQQEAWQQTLSASPDGNDLASSLAGQFNLDLHAIHEIASTELPEHQAENKPDTNWQQCLWRACLLKTTPNLDQLAQRIEAKATWEDLVLPQEALALLHQIVDQVRMRGKVYNDWGFIDKMNRGLGLSALFAGESGTGKTMAAEVIANALQLNLYRIDLSSVVSKYIGETEKNLRRLFDAAEDGGAVLLFDECDALFGKRSEVKDSHDRYANIEINYLLQRIEVYRGLAILATNMKSSLDQAFMRRLRFIVNFPFPGLAERRKLWENSFPSGVPKQEAKLDYDRLAHFNLTGGNIHNIALNSAFLAAAQKKGAKEVTMSLIFEAIRRELRKLDKPINEAEFRHIEVVGGNL
jgi:hypothetical protein